MTDTAATARDAWTIGRLLDWTRAHFEDRGLCEPRLAAELLLARALDCKKIDIYVRFNQVPSAAQIGAFREMVKAAARREPIAYLIGRKEFYSLDFAVSPAVLVPRPETETLVEQACAWCDERAGPAIRVLDIGTGSGCIAVTIAKRVPAACVIATDLSPAALAVAADNARRHGVQDRVRCVEADLLDLPADVVPEGGFDLVVSNPPYVAEDNPEMLDEDVRRFEPAVALFGGSDGLDIYRRIASGVPGILKPRGSLFLEIGRGQGGAVEDIFRRTTGLIVSGRYADLAGIERVLRLESAP